MAQITFIISGGVPDYTVEIVEYGISELFPAEGTYIISGDFSGCFTLTVTDADGCVSSAYDCCPTITWDAEFISHTCEQTWECDLDYNILEISFLTTTTTSTTSTSSTTTTVEPTTSTTTSTSTSTTTTTSTTSEPTTTTTTTVEPTTTTTTTCDPSKCDYGLLYNWYAVNTGKLAPTGWHVPTDEEWTTLSTYLGGEEVAGGKMKTTGTCNWIAPNEGATNESGFSGLPDGYRLNNGSFGSIGYSGGWWSSTELSALYAWDYYLTSYDTYLNRAYGPKGPGFSVRCIRDTYEGWENDVPVVDYDGNEYDVVEIGTQLWLVQNLKVTHYNDGEAIPNVEDNTTWAALTTGALCAYNNDWETYACVSEPTTTTSTTVESTTTTTTTVAPTTTTTSTTTIEPTTTTTTSSSTTSTTTLEPTTTTTTTCADGGSLCDYGLLYNAYAVLTDKLAPTDWRVPTNTDMETLRSYVAAQAWNCDSTTDIGTNVDNKQGKAVSSACFFSYADPATYGDCAIGNESYLAKRNISGLSLVPSGYRGGYALFQGINDSGFYWTSSVFDGSSLYYATVIFNISRFCTSINLAKYFGISVRCVRDTYVGWENDLPFLDYDGNEYTAVEIGTQLWMVQNLKVTHYNDGEIIPNVEETKLVWNALTTGALCAYNFNWDAFTCMSRPTTTTTTTTP